MSQPGKTQEHARLEDARNKTAPWRKWGPYLSERQWGSVRENVTQNIEAWNDVTHDQSRSRAYQSGEDGIAGFCDENMLVCFSLGLWNGKDPILKERLFGLTNSEGNHGEDVKEYYFYLDSTPTHSYAKMLYKYPQAAFPYAEPGRRRTARRSKTEFEYELMDTGVFDEDRYWDVFVEYAKADPEDIHIRITAVQPRAGGGVAGRAAPALVPQHLVGRPGGRRGPSSRPATTASAPSSSRTIRTSGRATSTAIRRSELLFTDNETNRYRLWGQPNPTEFQKDGINDYIVTGRQNAVNPARKGTKAASHHPVDGAAPARARRSGCA